MSVLRFKTIDQFSTESGYTPDAIRAKIRDGVWLQNRIWIKAIDGRILIDVEGYYEWVEMARASKQLVKRASKSPLPIAVNDAASASSLSPRPLT